MRPPKRPILVSLAWATGVVRCAINLDGSQAVEPASEDNPDDPSPIGNINTYQPDQHDCPPPCVDYANIHSWIPYLSVERLSRCKAAMLLQLSVSQPLDAEDSTVLIRNCTVGCHSTAAKMIDDVPVDNPKKDDSLVQGGSLKVAPACVISGTPVSTKLSIGKGEPGNGNKEHIASLLEGIKKFFNSKDNCDQKFVFAHYQQTVPGVYIGPGLGKPTVESALDALELCGNGRKPRRVFGVAVDTKGDLATVQKAVLDWSKGTCAIQGAIEASGQFLDVRVFDLAGEDANLFDAHSTPSTPNPTPAPTSAPRGIAARLQGTWKRTTCAPLSREVTTFASQLATPTTPPRQSRTPMAHASLASSRTDSCDALAKKHGVTVADIQKWNAKKTWAWTDCKSMLIGYNMCVGPGLPPLPPPQKGAECGPLVPGTKQPKDSSTSLADLNPCPLKACCSNWGFCGVFPSHCKDNAPKDGGSGTRKPGFQNTCVSNCNHEIKQNSGPPKKFARIGYYEAFDGSYTHIHWAFASIDPQTWKPVINQGKNQWRAFKNFNQKRVVSIGGWADSTEPGKFNIIRSAIIQNRETFATNLAQFAKEEGIDGINIDLEYPGAPDIMVDGKPIGEKSDGLNYLRFLTVLKDKMPSDKTVSIAAPASYWYLKQFPIHRIAEVIDYIVFMTYDLHGQWDYGNANAFDECPSGKFIRSHVTKAGVLNNKIFVGEASYGRSFRMAKDGCYTAMCEFTGSRTKSNANPGRCTKQSGYLANAEINEIILKDGNYKTFYDKDSQSNILLYSGDYDFVDGTGYSQDYPDDYEPYIDVDLYPECQGKYTSFKMMEDSKSMAPHCVEKYIVDVEVAVMEAALKKYKALVDGGYDEKFEMYEGYVSDQVPDQVEAFMISGKADDYFKCTETKTVRCCSNCNFATCLEECDKSKGYKDGKGEVEVTCPKILKSNVQMTDHVPNVTFTLQDPEGFWQDIGEEYGIDELWIKFGRRHMRTTNGCQFSGEDIEDCIDKYDIFYYNYPIRDKVEVPNPKELVGEPYDESKNLLSRLKIMKDNTDYDELLDWADVLDAGSLPALTMQAAVESMDKIVETAKEIEKKLREEFIVNFIRGLLFFIPVAGQALGSIGMSSLRSLLLLAGATGEAGLMVYGIVEDPANAFMTVFSALAGAGVGRSGITKAANARRSMETSDINKLGL
ncbi:glycoside hydrolase family 18 protein [Dactylonectria macrodidyma]|uniref:chitinase n=1 Tax=Dactylonectria macrodidyma TaxID=307937 RepID=A0A9P9ET04_9HYPO|nr:glycoside hydrolase family 18 protein [Dactylonectria macrodidyma]